MPKIIWIIALLAILGIGFTGDFYTANFFQEQIQVLVGAAIVLAVLTWVGSATDLLGLLREWFKEKREEEKIPSLVFDGYTKSVDVFVEDGNKILQRYVYFVKVRKHSGDGYAENCEGFLTVNGTNINNAPTVWAHANARHYNIGGRMDLRLFTIDRDKIIFPAAHLHEGFKPNSRQYDQFLNRNLIVELHAQRGRVPNKLDVGIQHIIDMAVEE